MKLKTIILAITSTVIITACKHDKKATTESTTKATPKDTLNHVDLISVKDGKFYKGDQPYYFIGANYWYGPLIGAKNIGDRERLVKELDLMKSVGIDNLRILAGAEGDGSDSSVHPALQPEQGKYNQDLLDGLDFLLAEMRKRNMYAVLYMNNNWIWSGGMSEYLEWNGYGEVPNPFLDKYTWDEYMAYTMQFHSCKPCKEAFYNHIKFLMGRTNTYTGLKYTDDNTIMSWQVANEPRVMVGTEYEAPFKEWLNTTVDLIESLDSTHLISTGAEGKASYLDDITMYDRLHNNPNIDYLTMHMWPKNWGWYDIDNEAETTQLSIKKANAYMNQHLEIASKQNKPIVMSEFGFPREKESLSLDANIDNRDTLYKAVCNRVTQSKTEGGHLAGLNFWGFAGYGKANKDGDGKWQHGDDFTADPPQEPQGLNSVFASDTSTLEIIKNHNDALKN